MFWLRGFACRAICSLFKHSKKLTVHHLTAIATLILALATAYLAWVANRQLDEMKSGGEQTATIIKANKKLAEAAQKSASVSEKTLIASQRAWIKAEVGVSGPLIFDQNGASASIAFKITNFGTAPALNVTANAWFGIFKTGGPSPLEEQRGRCDVIRQQGFGSGYTLFPAEIFPSNIGLGAWSLGVNITPEEIEKGLESSVERKYVLLFIVGCIDYTFPADPDHHHQTGISVALEKNDLALISPQDGKISNTELHLSKFGISNGRYAD